MRPILVSTIVMAVLVGFASLTLAQEAGQAESRAHRHLMTIVEKVGSGIVWFRPTAGLEHRAVSLHKAERMGLYDPEVEFIEITNADGKQTFAMDESSGSKLSMLHEGKLVRAEVNEDNIVIDIYPSH